MPKIAYIEKRFNGSSQDTIDKANTIIAEYQAKGFDLTLRQLYYQFVSRDLIPNNDKEYKRLGSIISEARLAGLVDWNAITDRTRSLRKNPHWSSPREIMQAAAQGYAIDRWATQPYRVEVWIEKDALVGVFEGVCEELDVPFFSCRGYSSQSEMWVAAQRLLGYINKGQMPLILHFGDHDPSGKDMTRDIADRLALFTHGNIEVNRLALTMDQIDLYNPPPNPAKITDARAAAYIAVYGEESWELDALSPEVLAELVQSEVSAVLDEEAWEEATARQEKEREHLKMAATHWKTLTTYLDEMSLVEKLTPPEDDEE